MYVCMYVYVIFYYNGFRLDQTLGKPGLWSGNSERDKQKTTVMSGLNHIENKVILFHYYQVILSARLLYLIVIKFCGE